VPSKIITIEDSSAVNEFIKNTKTHLGIKSDTDFLILLLEAITFNYIVPTPENLIYNLKTYQKAKMQNDQKLYKQKP